jgi:guanine nucleotide exchange factor/GDI displacement factor SidM-like protein/nucleotidyltransferase-like protein
MRGERNLDLSKEEKSTVIADKAEEQPDKILEKQVEKTLEEPEKKLEKQADKQLEEGSDKILKEQLEKKIEKQIEEQIEEQPDIQLQGQAEKKFKGSTERKLEEPPKKTLSEKKNELDVYTPFMEAQAAKKTIDATQKAISRLIAEKEMTAKGKRFSKYVSDLKDIVEKEDKDKINRLIIDFLKTLFIDALEYHGMLDQSINVELCIAGSLARNQATPFSDIDCFLIFSDSISPEKKKKIGEIANEIYYLANGLFTHTNQFCMDPLGISLPKLNGSVAEIVTKVQALENMAIVVSVSNAISILGNTTLLNNLQSELKNELSIDYFDLAIKEFKGPASYDRINIKSDLIRPIDFLLQGFREKENLSPQEYPNSKKLLDELVKRKIISLQARVVIEQVQSEAYHLRLQLHKSHGGEKDEIRNPDKSVKELVYLVGWLRGSLKEYQTKGHSMFDIRPGIYLSNNNSTVSPDIVELQKATIAKNKATIAKSEAAIAKNKATIAENEFDLLLKDLKKELNSFLSEIQKETMTHVKEKEKNMKLIGDILGLINEYEGEKTKSKKEKTKTWQENIKSQKKLRKAIKNIYKRKSQIEKKPLLRFFIWHKPKVPSKSILVTQLIGKFCKQAKIIEKRVVITTPAASSPPDGRKPK